MTSEVLGEPSLIYASVRIPEWGIRIWSPVPWPQSPTGLKASVCLFAPVSLQSWRGSYGRFLGHPFVLLQAGAPKILSSIAERIAIGDPFRTPWLSMGPRLRWGEPERALPTEVDTLPAEYLDVVYLVHRVGRLRVSATGQGNLPVQVWLDADTEEILDRVDPVIYRLPPSMPEFEREFVVTDKTTKFVLNIPHVPA